MKIATIINQESGLKWVTVAMRPFFVFHRNARWRINYNLFSSVHYDVLNIKICESITKVIDFMVEKTGLA